MRRNFTFPNLFVEGRRVHNNGRTGHGRQMRILRAAFVAASLALCGITAGSSRVASPLASVREWVGSYAFTYTEKDRDSHKTEIDKGTVSFTFFADGNGGMNGKLPISYRGTAQAQSSYHYVWALPPPCGSGASSARRARTSPSDLYITSSGYNWSVNGFMAKSDGHGLCPPAKHVEIGQLAHINFVPLPSGLVLCGTVDITRGKKVREHFSGHWAFYPEGQAQSAMPSGCPRVLRPMGTYISLRASKERRIGR